MLLVIADLERCLSGRITVRDDFILILFMNICETFSYINILIIGRDWFNVYSQGGLSLSFVLLSWRVDLLVPYLVAYRRRLRSRYFPWVNCSSSYHYHGFV